MRELLIAKAAPAYAASTGGGTISGYNEVDLLVPGAIALFTAEGSLITSATTAASLEDSTQFYICLGRSVGGVKRSRLIDRNAFHFSNEAYVAPVKEVRHLGFDGSAGSLNLPATLIAGTRADFSVQRSIEGVEPANTVRRYSYLIKAGDVEADVVAGLVAKVNADTSFIAFVDAVAEGTTGIKLTAKDFGVSFTIGVDELLESADRTLTTEINFGTGTPEQVAELEALTQIEDGNSNRVRYAQQYFSAPSLVEAGVEYNMYHWAWTQEKRDPISNQNTATLQVAVAIPDGAGKTELDAILNGATTQLDLQNESGSGGNANAEN